MCNRFLGGWKGEGELGASDSIVILFAFGVITFGEGSIPRAFRGRRLGEYFISAKTVVADEFLDFDWSLFG